MEVKPQFCKIVWLIWNSFSDSSLKQDVNEVLVTVIKEGVQPLNNVVLAGVTRLNFLWNVLSSAVCG